MVPAAPQRRSSRWSNWPPHARCWCTSRDPQQTDPRFVFARQLWRTDSHQAALSLIAAGLAWGWLPKGLVESHIGSGALMEIPVLNLSNGTALFVDWVWSKERPQGLTTRRFVELMTRQPAGR